MHALGYEVVVEEERSRRRLGPTYFLVMGVLWSALAVGQWFASDSAFVRWSYTGLAIVWLCAGALAVCQRRKANAHEANG
ncbi:hypothetical protein [Modestobacter sp. SYSU DS0875]